MKRKLYEKIYGKWQYKPDIQNRTSSMLDKDILFIKNILEERGTLIPALYKELYKLLLERSSRIGNNKRK